ncbi:unnamed protein product [Closterium sp. NIES-64]|nr:unnamed protein product [Closterium sp. NIES-64]
MYITLYYIVTRLLDSLRVVRDHFLSVCPTTLTVCLLKKALLAIEKSIIAVGASRVVFESVGAAFYPERETPQRQGQEGQGHWRGWRGWWRWWRVGVVVGVVLGVVAAAAAVEAAEAVEVAEGAEAAEVVEEVEVEVAEGAEAAEVVEEVEVEVAAKAAEAAAAVVERVATLHRGVAPAVRGGGFGPCSYVLRIGDRTGEQCGDLAKAGVAIFDLDFDAILAVMYAVADSVEGACYPSIEATALGAGETTALGASASTAPGASASAAPGAGESALSGTTSAQAFYTFTLDSAPSSTLSRLYLPSFSTNLVWSGVCPLLVSSAVPLDSPLAPPPWSPLLAWSPRHGLRSLSPSSSVSPSPSSGLGPLLRPYVEGRQRAAPHFSEFPPTEAPLQTLHMDVWGPARVSGASARPSRFWPLHSKWIAERRIGMVMDVARTSMMHAAGPHFLWPFAVQYAAHQLNLQPWVSLPETSPALRWTGKVGDASAFRDVTFDESVPYYRLFPYRTAPLLPRRSSLRQLLTLVLLEVLSLRCRSASAGSGGGEFGVAEPRGAEPGGGGSARVAAVGASSRREPLSPQELC